MNTTIYFFIYRTSSFHCFSSLLLSLPPSFFALLQLWSLDGTVLKILHAEPTYTVSMCAFSSDGQLIAAGVDKSTVKVQLTILE